MNAAAKATGLDVGPTRPLSRAERRAQAARVKADEAPTDETSADHEHHHEPASSEIPTAPAVTPPPGEGTQPAEPVRLKARQRKVKSPFATQLHAGTLARLEWIKARGYVITDTVDDAINSYLDNAGIPRPDHNDHMP